MCTIRLYVFHKVFCCVLGVFGLCIFCFLFFIWYLILMHVKVMRTCFFLCCILFCFVLFHFVGARGDWSAVLVLLFIGAVWIFLAVCFLSVSACFVSVRSTSGGVLPAHASELFLFFFFCLF